MKDIKKKKFCEKCGHHIDDLYYTFEIKATNYGLNYDENLDTNVYIKGKKPLKAMWILCPQCMQEQLEDLNTTIDYIKRE